MLQTNTGSFSSSFLIAAIMLIVGAGLTFSMKASKPATVPAGVIFEPQLGFTMADGGEKIEKKDK
jgi:hypothetical protein